MTYPRSVQYRVQSADGGRGIVQVPQVPYLGSDKTLCQHGQQTKSTVKVFSIRRYVAAADGQVQHVILHHGYVSFVAVEPDVLQAAAISQSACSEPNDHFSAICVDIPHHPDLVSTLLVIRLIDAQQINPQIYWLRGSTQSVQCRIEIGGDAHDRLVAVHVRLWSIRLTT